MVNTNMKDAVIDTMVFAYGLLNETEYAVDSLAAIARTETIHVPDSIRAELTNVIWQWITLEAIPVQTGLDVLQDANTLFSQVHPTEQLWREALILACEDKHSAYDTLFITLAKNQEIPLITYDKKLLKKYPAIAIKPESVSGLPN
ncbi:type II toxin-antitoxin system VapC family toxin [Endozoicomonas sp. 4G]|uniref:type II toxin-antitoxin system VapC family toxin n=1 Tax=Endozoicomonas sp. 4G TaxID=2872754 RepID=UPI0020785627|nr:type II toxin-antitoxin system VapC family toxin [Endozoicomonas sp. 4G]